MEMEIGIILGVLLSLFAYSTFVYLDKGKDSDWKLAMGCGIAFITIVVLHSL